MAAQPWLEQLHPVDRRAFVVLKRTATDEERAAIRAYIERPLSAHQQQSNARFIAALVNGSSTLSREPCPPSVICAGLARWAARQEELNWHAPNYVTAVTFIDEVWDQLEATRLQRQLEDAKADAGFQCASLRNHDPKSPVWVTGLGMVDPADPRHPHHGTPECAKLGRDGMYHVPRTVAPAPPRLDLPSLTPDLTTT